MNYYKLFSLTLSFLKFELLFPLAFNLFTILMIVSSWQKKQKHWDGCFLKGDTLSAVTLLTKGMDGWTGKRGGSRPLTRRHR